MNDYFDQKIINNFTNSVLNFVFDINKSLRFNTETIQFVLKLLSKKAFIEIKPNEISSSVLGEVDIEIKGTCIRFLERRLMEKEEPLSSYSSERIEKYKDILKSLLNVPELPWILNYIIDTINVQCEEFLFIIFYLAKERSEQSKDFELLSNKLESTRKDIYDNLPKIKEATEGAIQAQTDAMNAAKKARQDGKAASKKVTETSVTVLGMFSGIVITLVAGLFYSSSVLDNINTANFYRLICVASIVGLVCLHLVALMFRCIEKFRYIENRSRRLDKISIGVSVVLLFLIVGGFVFQILFPVECNKHNLLDSWTIDKEATCTEIGTKYRSCQVCKKIIETETIPILNHEYETVIVQQVTCVDNGMTYQKCVQCDEITDTEIILSQGHEYDIVVDKRSTCVEEGITHKKCSICGDVTEPQIVAANGHNFEEIIDLYPTCIEAGRYHLECTNCSTIDVSEVIPAMGHNYEEVIMIPATATEAGEKRLWCATCNALTDPIIIPPYGE